MSRSDLIYHGLNTPKVLKLFGFDFCGQVICLHREVEGELVGAFAYTGLGSGTVQMHYAGTHKRWMTKRFLNIAFTYPFDDLKVTTILAFLPPEKTYARDVAIKLGFRNFGGRPIPGVGIHMLTMVREDCRWLSPAEVVDG